MIGRIRALIKKAPPRKDGLEINDAVLEVDCPDPWRNGEDRVCGADATREGFAALIQGDRVQLQQVILNLIVNAVEAMNGAAIAEIADKHQQAEANGVLVAVGRFRSRAGSRQPRPRFRRFLHNQSRRIGYGSIDQPFDCRSSWRSLMGDGKRAARRGLSIHSARTSGRGVVISRPCRHIRPPIAGLRQ